MKELPGVEKAQIITPISMYNAYIQMWSTLLYARIPKSFEVIKTVSHKLQGCGIVVVTPENCDKLMHNCALRRGRDAGQSFIALNAQNILNFALVVKNPKHCTDCLQYWYFTLVWILYNEKWFYISSGDLLILLKAWSFC